MMGDKCAELVRAAMIGALAVTLGNPTADPGQIGIEIAGEAAVGAASFCVEEDAAEEAPAEAEEVTEPEGTQNDEMEEESGSEGKEDETVPEEPEPQETAKRTDRGRAKGKIFPTIHGRGRKKSAAEMGSRWNRRRKKTDLQEVMMQLVGTRRQKSLRILTYHSLRNRQPPRLNPSFRQSRKLSARGKATVSGRRQKLKKSRFPVCRGCFIRLKKHMLSPM